MGKESKISEKVKTGIESLDKILFGGVKRSSSLLLTGAPGTGKTIMALQFIYNGAKLFNEAGIFITTEESVDEIRSMANSFGMDIESYEKKGKITFIEKPVVYLKGGITSIQGLTNLIKQKNIKRVALDSLIFFKYIYQGVIKSDVEYRRQILIFIQELKKCKVTFLAISQKNKTNLDNFEYETMDFLFEGFIFLTRVRKGSSFERIITVVKMRGQEHSLDIYPLMIDNQGVRVLTDEVPFSLVEGEPNDRK